MMKAVILAAGEGSRMQPLTAAKPKAMLAVAGKPVVEHLVCEMAAAGIRDFIFVTGYKAERIKDHFGGGESLGISIEYCFQEYPDGTAAALSLARGAVNGLFLVMNGDSIVSRADVARMIALEGHQIGVKEVGCPERFGVVEREGERVVRIHEKPSCPPSDWACTGLYLFTPDIFEAIAAVSPSARGEYELTAAVDGLIESGARVGCCRTDSWQEISYPWDMLDVGGELMAGMENSSEGIIEEGVSISGAVRIGAGSRLRAGTYISGPVIIGRDCELGPNCYIRAATAIGDRCRIGAGVEIKNSIIMDDTKIPHLSYVGDSVIGENCNLGAGTKVANMRLDGGAITPRGTPVCRDKFGAVIGDGVRTGLNVCINPGAVVGGGTLLGPGTLVYGEIKPGSRVFCPR